MDLHDLSLLYCHSPQVAALAHTLRAARCRTLLLRGLTQGALPVVVAALQQSSAATTSLLVLPDDDAAGYAYNDLCRLLSTETVLFFPSAYKRAARYGQRDAANEVLRSEVLARLMRSGTEPLTIVSYPAALAERVPAREEVATSSIDVAVGQRLPLTTLEQELLRRAFTRVDYVYEPGQIAVRGSIIDVFSYSSEMPYRIDFFGDEVDSIRTFEIDTQLSKEKKRAIVLLPSLAADDAATAVSFLSLLPKESLVFTHDLLFVRDSIQRIYDEGLTAQALEERTEGKTAEEQAVLRRTLSSDHLFCSAETFMTDCAAHRLLTYGSPAPSEASSAVVAFSVSPQMLFHKNFRLLRTTLADYQQQGYHTYLLADSDKQQQRLQAILTAADGTDGTTLALPTAIRGVLHEGFVDNDNKCCFFTDHQIFDRFHKYSVKTARVRQGKATLTMKEVQTLQVGDYLVHIDFGIGRFGGLVRKATEKGGYKEEIRLIYQRGDIVDISIHALYKISKYRSNEGAAPRLSTLGTGAWERMKEHTKRRIKEVARDLIRLYAQRRQERGFAFAADSYMQQALEASFLYEDTPDQLRTTQEVKSDMEAARPMDRLICGDVGFGKTEIAIRAAFKAAADNKQVAVLVPTTVLAFQHYQTFSARLRDFPVRVDYLSRARTAKKAKEILADVAAGKIDILIGTHKLISKSVTWHDLGLLIIDEEQKFGVSAKEKLRQLRTNIDTITMTATPIPRTLQFSLMGARDMSVMRTPPANRYPIATTIALSNDRRTICDAINFEMSRNGQVFVVNDRVAGLPDLAAMIRQEVPDCRLAIGHGQMNAEELEQVLLGFINYDYDVLLSTTIIENGVDIPNANTIIINDAHHFGLADLHQMRGRVGRSNRKAFCYLLAPPLATLPVEARRRLEAVETFADLGAGFALSLQDLDIRGAGNLLGREQSGFIADLGYETYQKILTQAMTELKNDEFHDLYIEPQQQQTTASGEEFVADCTIESDLEMYFPDEYVPTAAERMLLYRELDNITSDEALAAYRTRLVDRFGAIPHEGEELMSVVLLRRYGRQAGCEKIMLRQGLMNMQFVANHESPYYQSTTFGAVLDFIAANARRCQLKEVGGRRLMHIRNVNSVQEAVAILRSIATRQ